MIRGLELLVPPPDFWGGERTLQLNRLPLANDLINHDFVMKLPLRPKKDRVWRASRLVNTWRYWESGALEEGMGAACPFPRTSPCASLAVDSYPLISFYNKLVI